MLLEVKVELLDSLMSSEVLVIGFCKNEWLEIKFPVRRELLEEEEAEFWKLPMVWLVEMRFDPWV